MSLVRRRQAIWLAAVLLVTGVIVWSGTGERSSVISVTSVDAPLQRPEGELASQHSVIPVGFFGAPSGTELCYQFALRMATRMGAGWKVDEGELTGRLSGTMSVRVLERSAHESLVRISFAELRGSMPRAGDVPALAISRFRQGLQARVAANGEIRGVRFTTSQGALDRALLQSIVLGFRFVVPTGDAPRWQRQERDLTGRATVEYERTWLPKSGTTRIVRRPTSYDLEGGAVASTTGHATAVFESALGWFRTVRVERTLVITIPRLRVETREKVQVEVTLIEKRPFDRSNESLPDWEEQWQAATTPPDVEAMPPSMSMVTVADLVSEMVGAGQGKGEHSRIQRQLCDLLVRDPQACAVVAEYVLDQKTSAATRIVLASTLARAGTRAAQRTLAELLESPDMKPNEVKAAVLRACVQIRDPSPRLRDAVWRGTEAIDPDVAGSSMLIAGALGHRASDRGMTRKIASLEVRARSAGLVIPWLAALGNCASAEVIPHVERSLRTGDPRERIAAIRALQRVRSQQVEQLLDHYAKSDREPSVRAVCRRVKERRDREFGR